jgi:hypothetical protein
MGRTTRLHQATPPQRAARARAMNPTHPAPGATAARSPLVALQQSIGNRTVGRLAREEPAHSVGVPLKPGSRISCVIDERPAPPSIGKRPG